nr:MAG TPA_asm: hypothetical protein [Caudoviricetes sp.]
MNNLYETTVSFLIFAANGSLQVMTAPLKPEA